MPVIFSHALGFDGIKAMLCGISGRKQVIKICPYASNRHWVCLLYKNEMSRKMYSSSFHLIYVIIVCCDDMIVLIEKK